MDVEGFVERHIELLELEKSAEADSSILLRECGMVSMSQVRRKGLSFPKLQLMQISSGMFGRTILKFQLAVEIESVKSRAISVGDIAAIFQRSEDGENKVVMTGVVAEVNSVSVALTAEEDPDSLNISDNQDYYIVKLVDDVVYRRMKKALQLIRRRIRDEEGNEMIRVLFYKVPTSRINLNQLPEMKFFNVNLNEKQKEAVKFALCQNEVAIIHGPPGTGKTTTLVEVILQVVKLGYKVLACGPSNVSVDNLVEKLSEYKVRMVRLGHPARSSQSAHCHTLDAAISSSYDRTIIQDIKKDLDSLKAQIKKEKNKDIRKALSRKARDLSRDMFIRKDTITQDILKNSDVVLSTISTANRDSLLKCLPEDFFDVGIIDECSQAIEALCWIPLLQVKKCVLAGDHLQLPPVINSVEAKDGLMETLMERLVNHYKDDVTRMLTLQYRMNSSIMNWSSKQLYDSRLEAHPSVASHLLCDLPGVEDNDDTCVPLLLIDTLGYDTGEIENEDESKGNEVEALLVSLHVEALIKSGLPASDIGVVNPYNFQNDLIRSMLAEKYPSIEIKSIDSFQGREKEAIVLSLVRSNAEGNIGFLAEDRRINVAITRARRHLAVVCNSKTVASHEFLKNLINYLRENGEVRSAFSYNQELNSIPRLSNKIYESLGSKKASVESAQKAKKGKKRQNYKQVEKKQKTSGKDDSDSVPQTDQYNQLQQKSTLSESFANTIKEFVMDSNSFSFAFPTSLTTFERRIVHEVAENFSLIHVSHGEGRERYIEIRKPLIESDEDFNETDYMNDSPKNDENSNKQLLNEWINGDGKEVFKEPRKIDGIENIKVDHIRGEDKVGVLNGRKFKKPAKKNSETADIQDDDFDAIIAAAKKENATCSSQSCNESTSISVLIKPCKFCKKQFCFKHLLPEVHGCGTDAKVHARQMAKKPQIPSSSSQKSVIRKHDLARRMEKILEEKNRERQRKSGKK